MLLRTLIAILLVTLREPAASAIIIGPLSSARPVSPMLYSSQITWPRQGNGALVAPYHRLGLPVQFNSFFVEKAREMRLASLRFMGDNVYYWRYGVGPYHLRPGTNYSQFGKAVWANDFGTDEFAALCRAIGAEPVVVAPYLVARTQWDSNAEIADQLAANWVEYCNSPSPGLEYGQQRGWEPTTFTNPTTNLPDWEPAKQYSPGDLVRFHGAAFKCLVAHTSSWNTEPGGQVEYDTYWEWLPSEEVSIPGKSWKATEKAPPGYFAWLREYFGHKDPHRFRYWEIGNEESAWGRGGPSWGRPENYARNALRIIRAMKSVDPTIKCGINLPAPLEHDRRSYQEIVCGTPGNYTETYEAADFLIWHIYVKPRKPNLDNPREEYQTLFNEVFQYEQSHISLLTDYPKPSFITEFNVSYGILSDSDPIHLPHMHRLKSGLAFACMLNQCARVGISALHQMYFADVGAWYHSTLFRMVYQDRDPETFNQRQGVTPTYEVVKLYSLYGRGHVIDTLVKEETHVDAQAFVDMSENKLRLFVVNWSHDREKHIRIDFGNLSTSDVINVVRLTGTAGMESSNEERNGVVYVERTQASRSSIVQNGYTFLPHSLTILDATLMPRDPGVSVEITVNNMNPRPGDEVAFIVTVRNLAGESISGVRVSVPVSPEFDYTEGSSMPQASWDSFRRVVVWPDLKMRGGESRQLKFRCRVR